MASRPMSSERMAGVTRRSAASGSTRSAAAARWPASISWSLRAMARMASIELLSTSAAKRSASASHRWACSSPPPTDAIVPAAMAASDGDPARPPNS